MLFVADREQQNLEGEKSDEEMWVPSDLESDSEMEDEENGEKKEEGKEDDSGGEFSSEGTGPQLDPQVIIVCEFLKHYILDIANVGSKSG